MDTKNSFVLQVKSLAAPMSSPRQGGGFIKVQMILRLLAIALASAAMVTMLTSDESISLFGFVVQARYSYSSAYKFLLVADAIVCACSMLSLIFVFLISRSKPTSSIYFAVFLHDMADQIGLQSSEGGTGNKKLHVAIAAWIWNPALMISMAKSLLSTGFVLLMMAGCGAATAIGMVGRDGIEQVGWSAVCSNVGKFCNRLTLSVASSYLVMLCYSALTVISVHKLKDWATGMNCQEGVSEGK